MSNNRQFPPDAPTLTHWMPEDIWVDEYDQVWTDAERVHCGFCGSDKSEGFMCQDYPLAAMHYQQQYAGCCSLCAKVVEP